MKVRLLALLLLGACSAQEYDLSAETGGPEDGVPAGTLRLDIFPPANNGTSLLPQSLVVAPGAYEGIDFTLLPTRTLSGVLTAEVVHGWSAGPPTTQEPVVGTLVALPSDDRLGGVTASVEDGSFSLTFPDYTGSTPVAIVPDDAEIAPFRVVYAPAGDRDDWDQDIPPGIPVYGRVTGTVDGVETRLGGVALQLSRWVEGNRITGPTFTTDDSGWYVARVDEPGDYTLTVVGSSFAEGLVAPSTSTDVMVEDDNGAEVSLALGDVTQAIVTGKVVDPDGDAVGDARVRFTSEVLDGGGELVVDTQAPGSGSSAGVFAAYLLPGVYDVEIMPPYEVEGVSPVRVENVRVDHTTGLGTLELTPTGRLTGVVTGADGQPAGNTLVIAEEQGFAGYRYYGYTDTEGRFDFAVPDVPMSITLTPGRVDDGAVTHVDVDSPGSVNSFALDAGVTVAGIARFSDLNIAYATLAVYDASSNLLLGQAVTGEDGSFSLRVSVPAPTADDTGDTGSDDSGTTRDSGDSGDTGGDSGGGETGKGDTGAGDTGAADTGGRDSG